MNLDKTLTSAVIVVALGLWPLAADGQGRGGGRQGGGGGRTGGGQPSQGGGGGRQSGAAQTRQSGSQPAARASGSQAAPRAYGSQAAPGAYGSQATPRAYGSQATPGAYGSQAAPRAYGSQGAARAYGSQATPRAYGSQAAPRAYGNQQNGQQSAPRAYGNQQYGSQQRQAVPRSSYGYGSPSYRPNNGGYSNGSRYGGVPPPRGGYGPGVYGHGPGGGYGPGYGHGYAHAYYGRGYARPYGWAAYSPYYFGSPYYSFSPWFSIGFGLSIGYPVAYPYTYLGSYQPRVYGSYDNGYYGDGYSNSVTAGVSVYGGMSFDIQPSDADLFVDGEYVGTVGTFPPNGAPLTLTPGQHRIVVQRDGYRSMEWDVTVEPGQVIPYRGAMQR